MEAAPLYTDVTGGPEGGHAIWIHTSRGERLRLAHWPGKGPRAGRGTVLIFPGRTEYAEKYSHAAGKLTPEGYDVLCLDWQGQGLSDRILPDSMLGHVHDFLDYQRDVAAMMSAAAQLGVPRPFHLLAHSMGGCIALRSLIDGISVATVTFSAPMWGINIAGPARPFAWALAFGSRPLKLSHLYAPGTRGQPYTDAFPFEDNMLTTDPEMFAWMQRQVFVHPELGLGGPSLHWVGEALSECRRLSVLPAPDVPCLTLLGTNERIVDPARIHIRMADWPSGRLEMIEGGEHEVLMEAPALRKTAYALITQHMNSPHKQDNPAAAE